MNYRRNHDDYAALFNRVTFRLGEENASHEAEKMTTPARLAAYRQGKADPSLETLYFAFGRYLLISSSRPGNLPANLQGIWHNNVDGPWRVDYHNNINLQMPLLRKISGDSRLLSAQICPTISRRP